MTGARDEILSSIKSATSARRVNGDLTPAISDHIVPARVRGSQRTLIERFCDMAEVAGAQLYRATDPAAVPSAVAAFLSERDLGDQLVLSSEQTVTTLPWRECPRLVPRTGAVRPGDRVSVTAAIAGIAETGTLLVASNAATPNALHFLPEYHVALIDAAAIVGSYEEALARLQASGGLPRVVTFVTGPSRTADIEKTPQVGVHGPRQLLIIVIDDPSA